MTVYVVTPANWNDPSFWAAINESWSGQVFDFVQLTSAYSVTFDQDAGLITLSDGSTTFTVGDATHGGPTDASLGGTTSLDQFSIQVLGDAAETIIGGSSWTEVEYTFSSSAINVDLSDGTPESGGAAQGDVLTNIDLIVGSDFDDTIIGDNSGIYINGGLGNDALTGGTGSDTFVGGSGADTITGGGGWDIVHYWDSDAAVFVDLTDGLAETGGHAQGDVLVDIVQVQGSNGYGDTIILGNSNGWALGFGGDDSITGGAGADGMEGGDGADTLTGGAGDDVVYYGSSWTGVTIDLTDGLAEVGGDAQGDVLSGFERIEGSWHDDTIILDNSGMSARGLGDNDLLVGGTGDDELYGDDGDDTLEGGQGADYLDGGGGFDTADYSDSDAGVDIDLKDALAESGGHAQGDTLTSIEVIYGSTGFNDTIVAANGVDSWLYGQGGDDILIGGGTNTRFFGGEGADTITDTFGGWDRIFYTDSDSGVNVDLTDGLVETGGYAQGDSITGDIEQIDASYFDDVVIGDDTLTTVYSYSGNDTLTGGNNANNLHSGADDDLVQGNGGDDLISAGGGTDIAYGGEGSDDFRHFDSFGNDTLFGGEAGSDFDNMDFTRLNSGIDVSFLGDESGTVTDGTDTITFNEMESAQLTDFADSVDLSGSPSGINIEAGDGADTIISGAGADTIDGQGGTDFVDYSSSAGAVDIDLTDALAESGGTAQGDSLSNIDRIDGSAFNDTLIADNSGMELRGLDGADSIEGGTSNDTLSGGTGGDTLTGGGGDDTFVYAVGDGHDTITDFNTGNSGSNTDGDQTNNDFIDLSGFYDNIHEVRSDFADDGVLNQSNSGGPKSIDYSDNDSFGPGGSLTFVGASQSDFTADNTGVVCFTGGTLIETDKGPRPIELLRVGDLVQTADNGLQPIVWLGQRILEHADLLQNPNLRPVVINPGSLFGNSLRLVVSPQHRLVLPKDRIENGSLNEDIFITAKRFSCFSKSRARVARNRRNVVYMHVMTPRHEVIFANGVASETLWPGPHALRSLSADARAEMFDIFPDLRAIFNDPIQKPCDVYGPLARLEVGRAKENVIRLRA